MVKRYSRKRRTYRKKRAFKKRIYKKRSQHYDGQIAIKCHQVADFAYEGTYGHGDYTINWGSAQTATNNYSRVTDSAEYTSISAKYREWRIIGVKMQFMPIQTVTSAANSNFYDGWYCSILDAVGSEITADNTIQGSMDFKQFTPSRGFRRYINLAKYYKKRGYEWIKIGDVYPTATSLLRVYCAGYNDETVMGKMHVTYYVKLRGYNL